MIVRRGRRLAAQLLLEEALHDAALLLGQGQGVLPGGHLRHLAVLQPAWGSEGHNRGERMGRSGRQAGGSAAAS